MKKDLLSETRLWPVGYYHRPTFGAPWTFPYRAQPEQTAVDTRWRTDYPSNEPDASFFIVDAIDAILALTRWDVSWSGLSSMLLMLVKAKRNSGYVPQLVSDLAVRRSIHGPLLDGKHSDAIKWPGRVPWKLQWIRR
jgi:hypothetical protein